MRGCSAERRRADDDDASLRSRYELYVDKVQPSVDYLKVELGSQSVALYGSGQAGLGAQR